MGSTASVSEQGLGLSREIKEFQELDMGSIFVFVFESS